jgi:hypothetical protein
MRAGVAEIGEDDNRCKELTNVGNLLQGYGTRGSRKKWKDKVEKVKLKIVGTRKQSKRE